MGPAQKAISRIGTFRLSEFLHRCKSRKLLVVVCGVYFGYQLNNYGLLSEAMAELIIAGMALYIMGNVSQKGIEKVKSRGEGK